MISNSTRPTPTSFPAPKGHHWFQNGSPAPSRFVRAWRLWNASEAASHFLTYGVMFAMFVMFVGSNTNIFVLLQMISVPTNPKPWVSLVYMRLGRQDGQQDKKIHQTQTPNICDILGPMTQIFPHQNPRLKRIECSSM